jgi:cytochrome c oxidase cbb3-type subunit 2
VDEGAHLYGQYCATCHESTGATRLAWQAQFRRLPPDLHTGPWLDIPASSTPHDFLVEVARIVKFGVPATDMPGHEYLSDGEIASISRWVTESVTPQQLTTMQTISGENR